MNDFLESSIFPFLIYLFELNKYCTINSFVKRFKKRKKTKRKYLTFIFVRA